MPDTGSKTYLSCAETAKLLRKALKADFPATKFSVRSHTYAGGASIDVRWTDGPAASEVDATCSLYNGATFDGMIDLKSYHDTLLMGEDGPQRVHMGADFIFTNREIGKARAAMYWREVEEFIGQRIPFERQHEQLPRHESGDRLAVAHDDGTLCWSGFQSDICPWSMGQAIRSIASRRGRWHGTRCPGGDGSYCPGCNRFQGARRAPHIY